MSKPRFRRTLLGEITDQRDRVRNVERAVAGTPAPGAPGTGDPVLRVRRSATLDTAPNGVVSIPWDQIQTDPAAMAAPGSNTLTVRRAGRYLAAGNVLFSSSSAGGLMRYAALVVNGNRLDESLNQTMSLGHGAISVAPVIWVGRLALGDLLRFEAYHQSTPTLNLAGSWLALEYLGP
jgi:hypothetical protein